MREWIEVEEVTSGFARVMGGISGEGERREAKVG